MMEAMSAPVPHRINLEVRGRTLVKYGTYVKILTKDGDGSGKGLL